jgi:hypothetical protein
MRELAKSPYVPEFQLVCVDPSPSRPPLPPWLKSVPTLVPVGADKPLVGPGPVMNWLFERMIAAGGGSKGGASSRTADDRRAPVYSADVGAAAGPRTMTSLPPAISGSTPATSGMAPPTLAISEDEPQPFHMSEMGGSLSNTYSLLNETNYSAEKGFDPITKNFFTLVESAPRAAGGAGARAAMAAPAAAAKRSAKDEELQKRYEAFAAARDRDVPGPMARK